MATEVLGLNDLGLNEDRLDTDYDYCLKVVNSGVGDILNGSLRVAYGVVAIEGMGKKLPAWVTSSNLRIFRKMVSGELLPEVFNRFIDRPMIVNRLSRYSIEDQRVVTENGKVLLVVFSDDGAYTNRRMSFDALQHDQVDQVCEYDRFRSEQEQRAWLTDRATKRSLDDVRAKSISSPLCRVDAKKTKLLFDGRGFLTLDEVLAFASQMKK